MRRSRYRGPRWLVLYRTVTIRIIAVVGDLLVVDVRKILGGVVGPLFMRIYVGGGRTRPGMKTTPRGSWYLAQYSVLVGGVYGAEFEPVKAETQLSRSQVSTRSSCAARIIAAIIRPTSGCSSSSAANWYSANS